MLYNTVNKIKLTAAAAMAAASGAILGDTPERTLLTNPVVSLATVVSPASAPSTTGFVNVLPVSSGYAASVSGECTAGSPYITNISNTSSIKAGDPVFEPGASNAGYPEHIPLGARVLSVDSASQVTLSKSAINSAGSVTLKTIPRGINLVGGVLGGYASNMTAVQHTTTSANPSLGYTAYAIEFMTDAANVSTVGSTIILSLYQNGATPNSYRVAIDDVYQTALPQAFGSTGSTWLTLQFSTPGVHKVRIELPPGYLVLQLWSKARLWRAEAATVTTALFFGDSFFAGGDGTYSWAQMNLAWKTSAALGWSPHVSAQGGTGYVNTGSVNYAWSSPRRFSDAGVVPCSACVLFGSVNDAGYSADAVTAAALSTWRGIRAEQQTAPMFIFGVPTTVSTNAAVASSLETALKTAFNAWGDQNAVFFPVTTDPAGAWIDAANTGLYISGDNTHLTEVGCSYVSDRMAQYIRSAL